MTLFLTKQWLADLCEIALVGRERLAPVTFKAKRVDRITLRSKSAWQVVAKQMADKPRANVIYTSFMYSELLSEILF